MDDSITLWPVHRLAAALRDRSLSSRELLSAMLARITKLNPLLNAVVTLDPEGAEKAAAQADEASVRAARQRDELEPLHGLPFTVKDAIEVGGLRSTGGASELATHVPRFDAPAISRLRAAGAIVLGKTNVPAWSADIQTFNDVFGTTVNPWNTRLTSGGSSGGAAVAVATGMSTFEIGTDIGGSIRIPASYCGIYGHKPSFGVVPQRGYLARVGGGLIDTDVNVFGPLARSVKDLALLLPVMAGAVPEDSLAWRVSLPPPRHEHQSEYRVAIWTDDVECPVDRGVRDVEDRVLSALGTRWLRMDRSAPPVSLAASWQVHDALVRAAVSPALPAAHGDVVGGTHRAWLAVQEQRAEIRSRWAEWFEHYDALICPIMPVGPFEHDHQGDMGARTVRINGEERPHASLLRWNSVASVANLPSTAVVIGWTTEGLPIGVQVIGPYLEDRTSLHIASGIEEATGGFTPPPVTRGV